MSHDADGEQAFERITELVHEHRRDDGQYGTVYVPPGLYHALRDWADYRTAVNDETIHGLNIVVDGRIDAPQILPESTRDLRPDDYYQADPPGRLVRELVTPEEREYTDEIRQTRNHHYRDYAFFEVTRRRQELDHDAIDRYGLDVVGEPNDYDREVDETVRVKFGREVVVPIDGGDAEREYADGMRDPELIERQFVDAMRDQTNSVAKHRVTGIRRRRFRFPYPCLDFEHTEEHHAGWRYVHYGRLFMRNIDTDAGEIDPSFAEA